MNQDEFLVQIVELLEKAGIPYMIAGSHGSSFYGPPRTTTDVDFVIDPTREQLNHFSALMGNRYYCSPKSASDAFRHRSMFNVIDFNSGWKADLILRKDRPFSVEEFSRKKAGTVLGKTVTFASPEDIILSKLEWNKITPSERQLRDAWNVFEMQGSQLDLVYLRKWAAELGVSDSLEDLFRSISNP